MTPVDNNDGSKTRQARPVNDVFHEKETSSAAVSSLEKSKPVKRINRSRYVLEVGLVVLLIAVGAYAFTLRNDNDTLKQQATVVSQNPQAAVEQQTKTQISKISKLMQLPTDEQPTVANVSDADQARKQSAFFKSAQNGDTVLMYVKSGQAILYRPSTNRIVLVAPLSFDQPSTSGTTSTTKR